MIITRYLVLEIFKSQCAGVMILFSVFFCQKLVRILNTVVDGAIPINSVLFLFWLGMPEMAQMILPMSLFLGLLVTFNRMYTGNEITAIYSCGLGKGVLIRAVLILSLVTVILAAVNTIWCVPWSSSYQEIIMSNVKDHPSIMALVKGQFRSENNGNLVIFVRKVKGKEYQHIFLIHFKINGNIPPSLMVADRGHITILQDGKYLVKLYKGTYYEGTTLHNFRVIDFDQYQMIVSHRTVPIHSSRKIEQMTMYQLWYSNEIEACAELHWRLTLIMSAFIMSLLVVPLSKINIRQDKTRSIFSTMLLYLIFFLLQSSLRYNGAKGRIDPILWMWATNIMYLTIAFLRMLWDCTSIRTLRERLTNKRIVSC